jgi:hypothetical protein
MVAAFVSNGGVVEWWNAGVSEAFSKTPTLHHSAASRGIDFAVYVLQYGDEQIVGRV